MSAKPKVPKSVWVQYHMGALCQVYFKKPVPIDSMTDVRYVLPSPPSKLARLVLDAEKNGRRKQRLFHAAEWALIVAGDWRRILELARREARKSRGNR